jgi:hypothetical protein
VAELVAMFQNPEFTSAVWTWAERASWIATLVGLSIALWQLRALRREQKRLARQFAPPRFAVGFGPDRAAVLTVLLEPSQDGRSTFTPVYFQVLNDGDGMAREVLINFSLDPAINGRLVRNAGQSLPEYLGDKYRRVTVNSGRLHAHSFQNHRLLLEFPYQSAEYTITVVISCAEIDQTTAELQLRTVTS